MGGEDENQTDCGGEYDDDGNGDGLDDNDCGGDDNGYAKVLNMRSWVFGWSANDGQSGQGLTPHICI